jgi:hypothetical protein
MIVCSPADVAAEPLPEMIFEADRRIIERYFSTSLTGAPVDPLYSAR